MATLAQLRARKQDPKKSRPTTVKRITLDQDLMASIERLDLERDDLMRAHKPETDKDGERSGPPPKAGVGLPARVKEIDAEREVLLDQIRDTEGELLLRAIEGGAWQTFKDDNPPREGNVTDKEAAYGLCNATALMASLGEFAECWEGDPFTEGEWDTMFAPMVAPGDLIDLVTTVVQLQERTGIRIVPKSSTVSSETEHSETD